MWIFDKKERERDAVLESVRCLQENLEKIKSDKDQLEIDTKSKNAERLRLKRIFDRIHIEREEERQKISKAAAQIVSQKEMIAKIDLAKLEINKKLNKWQNDVVKETNELEVRLNFY